MTALHIIGIYLQHGLGIHAGSTCRAEVGICLLAHGLLGTLAHQDSSSESSHCTVVQHILIQLAAGAMSHLMVNERIVVHTLHLVGNNTSVEHHLGALTLQTHIHSVAGMTIE